MFKNYYRFFFLAFVQNALVFVQNNNKNISIGFFCNKMSGLSQKHCPFFVLNRVDELRVEYPRVENPFKGHKQIPLHSEQPPKQTGNAIITTRQALFEAIL